SAALLPFHSFPPRRSSDLARLSTQPAGTVTLLLCEASSASGGELEALRPLFLRHGGHEVQAGEAALVIVFGRASDALAAAVAARSEEHTSELQSRENIVCR